MIKKIEETYTTEDRGNVYNKRQRKHIQQKTEETYTTKDRGIYTTRKLCAVHNLSLKAKHHIVHHN